MRLPVCECRHMARGSGRWYRVRGRPAEEACLLCHFPIVDRATLERLRQERREAERQAIGRMRKRDWADRKVEGGKKAWLTRRANEKLRNGDTSNATPSA